jgi:polysaccharide pyruvyl transferase WcaK-like protein
MLCEKPVIAISFHHKCESLMRTVGLSDYCLDLKGLQPRALIEKFCDLERAADNLQIMLRKKTAEYRKELDEQYSYIFDELSADRLTRSRGDSMTTALPA